MTGEILAGGNTYIEVSFDFQALNEARKEFEKLAESLINRKDEVEPGSSITVVENGRLIILYSPHWFNGNVESISICKRPKDWETRDCYCLDRVESYHAGSKWGIAEALTIFKYQYGFEI